MDHDTRAHGVPPLRGGPAGPASDGVVEFGDYLAVVRRRWLVLVTTAALVVAGVLVWLDHRTPTYQAQADVLVHPLTRDPLDDTTRHLVNVPAEIEVASSSAVMRRVARQEAVSVRELLDNARVTGDDDAELLTFRYADADPVVARRRAGDLAQAYLEVREERGRLALATSTARLEEQISTLRSQLDAVTHDVARLGQLEAPTAEDAQQLAAASSEQSLLASQLALLTSEAATRTLVSVDGGELLRAPTLPTSPVGPGRAQLLVLAFGGSLVAGLAVALLWDRLDPRVVGRSDVEDATGLSVLDDRTRSASPGERADPGRLIALRLRTLPAVASPRIVAVAELRAQQQATDVAGDIAAMLLQRGSVLVVDLPVGDRPLAPTTPVEVRTDPQAHTLVHAVVPGPPVAGRDPTAYVEAVEELVTCMQYRVDHVVLVAPPVARSLALLELATLVDEAYVVAVQRVTRRQELATAVARLRHHDVPLGGIVLCRRNVVRRLVQLLPLAAVRQRRGWTSRVVGEVELDGLGTVGR